MPKEQTGGHFDYIMYQSAEIASHPDVSLNVADLIVIALLAGGDYAVSDSTYYAAFIFD
jgi:hypothetical protein